MQRRLDPSNAAGTTLWLLLVFTLAASTVQAAYGNPEFLIETLTPAECDRKSQDGDTITVHYQGSLTNGTVFDSSFERGEPMAFGLGFGQVIEGFDKGLKNMCVGEKRKLTIPPEMAYGQEKVGTIPPGSTLIFEAQLMGIDGVKEIDNPPSATTSELPVAPGPVTQPGSIVAAPQTSSSKTGVTTTLKQDFGIQTAPAHPPPAVATANNTPEDPVNPVPEKEEDTTPAATSPQSAADDDEPDPDDAECKLLGPFAIFVQGGLGVLALFSVVWKRYREKPRRPVKVWFFDVSKQVVGSVLLHVANLLMSIFSLGDMDLVHKAKQASVNMKDAEGQPPNPCSLYLINLAIDTTIGIPILVILLRLLHHIAGLTPLARPPESIKSGHYGNPPRATWWVKQSVLYFIGLVLMKLCVLFIFAVLPWIIWVGDWALRWTEGNEALQVAFVMFIFPLIMNALQYYIIDAFIKDSAAGADLAATGPTLDDGAYEPLRSDRDDDEHGIPEYADEDARKGFPAQSARELGVSSPTSSSSNGSGSAGPRRRPSDVVRKKERSD